MTLADLRALLERAHGPAVERLKDHTPAGVVRAYMPRHLFIFYPKGSSDWIGTALALSGQDAPHERRLDLTDSGTVHAIKVALALALGLDPGAMGAGVSWRPRLRVESNVWSLHTTTGFESFVINEPDPIKALALACQHVIKEKA